MSSTETLFQPVRSAELGKPAAEHGLGAGRPVHLFVEVREDTAVTDTVNLSKAGISAENFFCGKHYSHGLRFSQKSGQNTSSALETQVQLQILSHFDVFIVGSCAPESVAERYTESIFDRGSPAARASDSFSSH